MGDTTVPGAGGNHNVDIDEKANSLQFYSSSNYRISGTNTSVPVQSGQLRSFTNAVGTFNATWTTGADGGAVFAGYKNSKNQTVETAVQELKEFSSSWKYKLYNFGSFIKADHDKDPLGHTLNITLGLLTTSASAAAEPNLYGPVPNSSTTTQESLSGLGTFSFAPKSTTTAIANYWPTNGGALGEWYQASALPGAKLDRIGSLGGNYMSPYGTPFTMRALPSKGAYRAFEVVHTFPLEVSITAPAFGELGGGIQYRTPVSVGDLFRLDYLKKIK